MVLFKPKRDNSVLFFRLFSCFSLSVFFFFASFFPSFSPSFFRFFSRFPFPFLFSFRFFLCLFFLCLFFLSCFCHLLPSFFPLIFFVAGGSGGGGYARLSGCFFCAFIGFFCAFAGAFLRRGRRGLARGFLPIRGLLAASWRLRGGLTTRRISRHEALWTPAKRR